MSSKGLSRLEALVRGYKLRRSKEGQKIREQLEAKKVSGNSPFVPSHQATIDAVAEIVREGDVFLDVGSGDGRLLTGLLAAEAPCSAFFGIEYDAQLVKRATEAITYLLDQPGEKNEGTIRSWKNGEQVISIGRGDVIEMRAFVEDGEQKLCDNSTYLLWMRSATIVFLYLKPQTARYVMDMLISMRKSMSMRYLVSNTFKLNNVKLSDGSMSNDHFSLDKEIDCDGKTKLHLYRWKDT